MANEHNSREKDVHAPLMGVLFALIAAIFWAVNALGINLATKTASMWTVGFAISLSYLPSVAFIRWEQSCPVTDRILTLLSGTFDSLALCFGVVGISMSTVGDASAIIFSRSLACAILTKLFLDEEFRLSDGLLTILNVAGIVMIVKPPFLFGNDLADGDSVFSITGSMSALICAVFGASFLITIRQLHQRGTYDTAAIFSVKATVGYCVCGAMLYVHFDDGQRHIAPHPDWGHLAIACCSGLLATVFTYLALRYHSASVVALIGASEVVVAYLLQGILTEDTVDYVSVVGAVFITASPVWFALEGIFSEKS